MGNRVLTRWFENASLEIGKRDTLLADYFIPIILSISISYEICYLPSRDFDVRLFLCLTRIWR